MEITLSQETREIAFHSQRSRLARYLVLFLFLDVSCIASLVVLLFIASGVGSVQPSPDPLLMSVAQTFMLLMSPPMLFFVIVISTFILFTIRRLVSSKPALLVTSEGISLQDLPRIGNVFLLWSEIATLYEYRRPSDAFFCLDPKEKSQFLSRFNVLQCLVMRIGEWNTGTLIAVPHWLLSVPVGEVLSHIQQTFDDELTQHHVQVFHK